MGNKLSQFHYEGNKLSQFHHYEGIMNERTSYHKYDELSKTDKNIIVSFNTYRSFYSPSYEKIDDTYYHTINMNFYSSGVPYITCLDSDVLLEKISIFDSKIKVARFQKIRLITKRKMDVFNIMCNELLIPRHLQFDENISENYFHGFCTFENKEEIQIRPRNESYCDHSSTYHHLYRGINYYYHKEVKGKTNVEETAKTNVEETAKTNVEEAAKIDVEEAKIIILRKGEILKIKFVE